MALQRFAPVEICLHYYCEARSMECMNARDADFIVIHDPRSRVTSARRSLPLTKERDFPFTDHMRLHTVLYVVFHNVRRHRQRSDGVVVEGVCVLLLAGMA